MRRQAGPGRGTDRIRTDVELRRGHDISAPRRVLRRVAQEYQPPAVLRQAGTGVRPSAPAPALLSGGDGRTAVIEIARDDLRPLARAISVEQADAAAEKATETLLADLLYWAARSRTRRATTP